MSHLNHPNKYNNSYIEYRPDYHADYSGGKSKYPQPNSSKKLQKVFVAVTFITSSAVGTHLLTESPPDPSVVHRSTELEKHFMESHDANAGAPSAHTPSRPDVTADNGDRSSAATRDPQIASKPDGSEANTTPKEDIVHNPAAEPGWPAHSDNPDTSFKIATFNIYHGTPGTNWRKRIGLSIDAIVQNQVDILMMQEVRENQWDKFATNKLTRDVYQIYPASYQGSDKFYTSENSIAYNKHRFSLVRAVQRWLPYKKNDAKHRKYPHVILKDKLTGNVIEAISRHDPAGPSEQSTYRRYNNALRQAELYERMHDKGRIVIEGSDLNSGYVTRDTNNITYGDKQYNLSICILARSGKYHDAYDLYNGINTSKCPLQSRNDNSVDHLIIPTSYLKVLNYKKIKNDPGNIIGSDVHDLHTAVVDYVK